MTVFLLIAGTVLVLAAALVSNTSIEMALGRAPGSLLWGPALFRGLLAFHGALLFVAARRKKSTSRGIAAPMPDVPWLGLVVLSVVALALRLIRLNTSLWLDEILALQEYIRPPVARSLTSFGSQAQHLLYSVVAHASMKVFGESAWAIRLPAVLFGVASIWGLYLLAQRLVGRREALLACGLMTVSYHHVWFSQNARGYTGLLLFTLLATWLWLEAMDRRRAIWWLGYSVVTALGLLIHMSMVFVPVTHLLLSGLRQSLQKRAIALPWQALAATSLAGTLALQFYALSLPEFLHTALGEVSLPSEWTNPLWIVTESMRSFRLAFAGLAIIAVGGLTAATGWLDLVRRDWAAAFAMLLPPVLSGVAMIAFGHNLWPRFFFFSMGFGLLIAVHGAVRLPEFLRFKQPVSARLGVALVSLLIVASAFTLPRCYAYPKQDYIGARDYVERHRAPGETVAAVGLAAKAYDYYSPAWERPGTDAEFEALRRAGSVDWLVYTLPIQLGTWMPRTWAMVQQDLRSI